MNSFRSVRTILLLLSLLLVAVPLTLVSAAEQDDNIFWNELGHNSRDSLYRSPQGAVPTGTEVRLRLRAADGDLTGATVRAWDDRNNVQLLIPMTRVASNITLPNDATPYEIWEATLPAPSESTVYWYRFIAYDGSATAYYEDDASRNGGWGQTIGSSEDRSWQMTFYDPAFQTPDWVKNAVIYQIFTDRFRDGDPSNNPVANDFFYGNYDTVVRSNDANGDWNANICDPRDSFDPGTCTGIWSQNFYGGDLQGIIDQLDYLADLGVTALYLNPIFESPSNHKYDTKDFMLIDDNFGDLGTFITLATEAENRGIRLILDGVFNHSSSDSVYFDRYSRWDANGSATTVGDNDESGACESLNSPFVDWYTFFPYQDPGQAPCSDNRDYPKWFGIFDSLPVFQHDYPAVRDYFINDGVNSVGPYWMQWADGWRLDVAPEVDHGTLNDPSDDYWEDFRAAVRAVNPEAYIVGEEWGNPTSWTIDNQWDATMNYQFSAAVLSFWRDTGFSDNDFNASSSAGPLNPLSPSGFAERIRNLEERYAPEAFYAMMNLFGSHDTNRVLFLLDHNAGSNNAALYNDPNYDWSDSISRLKGAALIQMTMPGAPTIYYGDEVGTVNPVGWDGSQWQDDPYNRVPYPWLDESGSPFYSHMQSQAEQDALYEYYASLTDIRNSTPALRTGSIDFLLTDDANDVLVYGRKLDGDAGTAVVVVNGADNAQGVTVDLSGYVPAGAELTDALNGGSYIVAADGSLTLNNVAGRSGAILVLGAFTGRPATITDLAATPSSGQVDLTWTLSANADTYNVYRSRLSGGAFEMIGSTSVASFSDTNVQNATTYFYVVEAVNSISLLDSGLSNEAAATPALSITWANLQWPPTITHTLSATTPTETIYGQIYIDGATDVIDGQVPGITAQVGYGPNTTPSSADWTWFPMTFNVEADNNDEYMGTLLPNSLGTFCYTTRYSADGGASWFYAANGPDEGNLTCPGPFGVLTVVSGADSIAPAAPTNLMIAATSSTNITLSWDAHPNTDGDLYGFAVYREDVAAPGYGQIATVVDPAATGYTDNTVTGGTTYNYVITALDTSLNESAQSNVAQGTAQMLMVDVTFRVTVPGFTQGSVYVAGSFPAPYPEWNPGGIALTETSPGVWETTLEMLDGTQLEYKYARGDWERVEKQADGFAEVPNRPLTVEYGVDGTMLVEDTVENWRDPLVTAFSPADGATDLPPETVVTFTWSKDMPPNIDGFSLVGPSGEVSGALSYDAQTFTHTFTPDGPLPGGAYTVNVSGNAQGGDAQVYPAQWSFSIEGSGSEVDLSGAWAGVQWPPEITDAVVDEPTQTVYTQIYIPGLTDTSGDPVEGVLAQVGYGPADADPATWTNWFSMTLNGGFDFSQNNDEYMGTMTPTSAGSFGYTTRFSGDGGTTWFYAVNGPNGSEPILPLTVSEAPQQDVAVTFTANVPAHTPTPVYLVGGFGPAGYANWEPGTMVMTETSPGVWQLTLTLPEGSSYEYKYTRGSWDTVEKQADGNSDIPFQNGNRSVTVADSGDGTQAVADTVENWRDPYVIATSPADGAQDLPPATVITLTWNQAMPGTLSGFDLTGPNGAVAGTFSYDAATFSHTFTPDASLADGLYTVSATGNADEAVEGTQQVAFSSGFEVEANPPAHDLSSAFFNLQWPHETTTTVGTPTENVYGQIFIDGVTNGPNTVADGITAQVGYGPQDADPATWTNWFPMTFNAETGPFGPDNDEYMGTITPTSAGTFAFTTRWSADGGATWFYTDKDGPGYSADQAGVLNVNEDVPETVDVTFTANVPAHTPTPVYLVGGFGPAGYANWEPGTMVMTETSPGVWQLTLTLPEGSSYEYKYTRGSWDTVEKQADGNSDIPFPNGNRSVTVADSGDGTQAVADTVENWRDPYVIAASPAQDASDVPADTVITMTWNQAMPGTLSGFIMTGPDVAVAGTFSYDAATFSHTFTPDAPLAPGLYGFGVTGNTDAAGEGTQQVDFRRGFAVAEPQPVLEVVSFTLIDADTDQPVPGFDPIPEGAQMPINTLPGAVNIRANVGGVEPASVVFSLNGEDVRTENVAPFALSGDRSGDYFPWNGMGLGDYTLIATPFSGGSGSGDAGTAATLNFSILPPETSGDPGTFTLVDVATGAPVAGFDPMPQDAVIDVATLGAFNIRYNPAEDGVGRVVFNLNGQDVRAEGVPPFFLAGDRGAQPFPWEAPLGAYTLIATPDLGEPGTISFTLVDSTPPPASDITGFMLVEAYGDYNDIRLLNETDAITVQAGQPITIVALTDGELDRVVFNINGQDVRSEGRAPYTLTGDRDATGAYFPWNAADGVYTITATPFVDGEAGTPYSITLTVTNE